MAELLTSDAREGSSRWRVSLNCRPRECYNTASQRRRGSSQKPGATAEEPSDALHAVPRSATKEEGRYGTGFATQPRLSGCITHRQFPRRGAYCQADIKQTILPRYTTYLRCLAARARNVGMMVSSARQPIAEDSQARSFYTPDGMCRLTASYLTLVCHTLPTLPHLR